MFPRVMGRPRDRPKADPRTGSVGPPTTCLRAPSEVVGGRAKPGHDTSSFGYAFGTVTPIMSPSRTIAASCASLQSSVPVGRSGSTIQR